MGEAMRAVLEEVAACRQGKHKGQDTEWVLAAIAVILRQGPADISSERVSRLVLDVRMGKRSVAGALIGVFQGEYGEHRSV